MVFNDGKTQKIDSGQSECNLATQRRRLGSVQESSRINGVDPNGTYSPSRSGQDSIRENAHEQQASDGKILERLDFVESAYNSYVNTHQQDLEARLAESKQHQEIFRQTIRELKQEIHGLISSQESEPNE
jgi:hypothetical protein